jgi:MarR family 2-MHQ and catechol resistance regulon transcriptional repressor
MGTRYRGDSRQVRALCAYINLLRAAETVAERCQAHLHHAGLTPTQFGVLDALLHLGPACQSFLGEKLLRSGANITLVVDNLEKARMVERQRSAEDRRFITVRLTSRGRALAQRLVPVHVRVVTAELSRLSAGEQDELRRLCRKLGRGEGEACGR